MAETVLVTGAFGLVGTATVIRLAEDGRTVVATDLNTPANRKAAAKLPAGVRVVWTDLTDADSVEDLLSNVTPAAIVHLAAMIPPFCYQRRELARKVNVDATANLLRAAEKLPAPPRFVQASSIAVYGGRNPHRHTDVLTADTPVAPTDLYGGHKVEAEALVRESALDWLILRLGGVLTSQLKVDTDPALLKFESALPADGRLQTVDVRDVARAFAAATTVDAVGQVLLIGGDDTHRLRQGEIASATADAIGLRGAFPKGRPGDPDSDENWFATDWMDSAAAQAVLHHQTRSFPQLLADTRANVGVKRYLLMLAAPAVGLVMKRRSVYYGKPGTYAELWPAIREAFGDPSPDRPPA
ncbi:NAD(P)-dependent oxidoreductase [Mycobacterium sp. MYCO198283]|uniref:NAD-dependent epimerase/dehydratase family protein n=1 Tax=Mycobacterium sp. MYCO198283 TaxID=2883505 RepID=UPI001E4DC40F|nr:NAD(P)-dependent oxidoreductase [Mycobacterium sp. MYCO198283]MCG5430854.1 NAD(P)-dependent oxidoreductase [Mycobacterium sp. MYCO198283]